MTESQSQMEVRAVKLIKSKSDGTYTPEITLHDPVLKCTRPYEDCTLICHDDFVNAVHKLNHHIAILTDYGKIEGFEDSRDIDDQFVSSGFSLNGREDELRVTLKGHKKNTFNGYKVGQSSGSVILNVPRVYLNLDFEDDKSYILLEDLKLKLSIVQTEALKYCFESKQWVDPQLSLDMPDPVTHAKILPPVTPETILGDLVAETNGKKEKNAKEAKGGKGAGGKKKPQTADNPKGE